jgi:hypothetical protein
VNEDEQTRRRLEIARAGLQGYEDWLSNTDPTVPISPRALADLASAARWLIETLTRETE